MKKTIGKMMALVIAMVMVLAMGMTVFAEGEPSITITAASTEEEGRTDTTEYTWYRIFEADITENPGQNGAAQSGGQVAYYVDSQEKASAIEGTGLFNVSQVGTDNKWYVELKDPTTTGDDIAAEFAKMDLTLFASGNFSQQTIAGDATSGTVKPGYYYITSTAGKNVVIQTLTAVEIQEKNEFSKVVKEILRDDANSEIGKVVTYTLTVTVTDSANDFIVLTDTMDKGLTFNQIASVKNSDGADVPYTLNPTAPTASDKTFTITFAKEDVIANQGKTITITYKAMVNKDAAIETDIPNEVVLKYGNNYTSLPSEAKTKTYKFTFDKVDADGVTKLTGAEFTFNLNGEPMDLVEVTPGVEYRIATSEDTPTTQTIVTNGNTVIIKGLDLDETGYTLVETKAPTGYNKLDGSIPVTIDATTQLFAHQNVENQKGSVLPSTGGMGTTIFYVIGGILVLAAAIILISKRRVQQ